MSVHRLDRDRARQLAVRAQLPDGDRAADLRRAPDVDRTLFEFLATARPMADLRLFRAQMDRAPQYARTREWLAANATFHRDVLARLRAEGPVLSRDPPGCGPRDRCCPATSPTPAPSRGRPPGGPGAAGPAVHRPDGAALALRPPGARPAAVHEDVPFTPPVRDDVDAELAALAGWLGLELTR